MEKRGQITLFIIVGVIVLIAASFFLYYRSFIIPEAEVIPEDLKPIKNYVDSCLDDVAEEGVTLMGMQGGYIDIPEGIIVADAFIELVPGSPIRIPYWYQNDFSYVPSIDYMQTELADYIRDNIKDCVDLEVLGNDFNIRETGLLEVETIIANNDIDIEMTYELIAEDREGEESKISKYHITLPVRLKQAYELSRKILDAENTNTYFENMTIDWMAMNRDIPFNGIEFHCGELTWKVRDVKDELQDTIYYNLPKVRVRNTNYQGFLADDSVYEELRSYTLEDIYKGNYPDIEKPEDAYDYSHYLMDARTKRTTLRAGFYYNPSWGLDLTARPSEGDIMKSSVQSGSDEFLQFMCLNVYHFNYDVVYPIEVLVRDDDSFGGEGFVFRYAFPVMVNHNMPDKKGFKNPEYVSIGGDFIGQCDNLKGPEYDIRAVGVDDFGIANMELKGVNLSYDCYRFTCDLGDTQADQGAYRLRTQLPDSCAHGFIVAKKDGYLDGREQVLDSDDVDVEMKRLRTLPFKVVMNDYNSLTGAIGDDKVIARPFIASIDIQSNDEPRLHQTRKYPIEAGDEHTIDMIQQHSSYKLKIYLFDEADNVLVGGYEGNWTATYNDVANGNEVIFHAASYVPKPLNSDGETDVWQFLEENNIYKESLKPDIR